MLPNVGTWELIIVLLVIFLLFGSKRLPEVARGLGKGIREFKREMHGISDEVQRPVDSSSQRPQSSSEPNKTTGAQPPPSQPTTAQGGKHAESGPVML